MSAQDIRFIYLIVSFLLLLAGGVMAVMSLFRLLLLAFKRSLPWGLASLLIPPALILFSFLHWEDTHHTFWSFAKSVALSVAACVLLIFYS